MKVAAFGLGLILLVLPFAAQSDENLVDKREACRQQARLQIAPKGKVGVDGFRRIVERRAVYVSDCMSRPFVAGNVQPLPPKRARDASNSDQEPATGSVRTVATSTGTAREAGCCFAELDSERATGTLRPSRSSPPNQAAPPITPIATRSVRIMIERFTRLPRS